MKTAGMTKTEIIVSAAAAIMIGVLLLLAVSVVQRRARDVQRLESLRSLQADIEDFRLAHASYPASLEAVYGKASSAKNYAYAPTPTGCGEDKPTLCSGYTLTFNLEGKIGGLTGGNCVAGPRGLTCSK